MAGFEPRTVWLCFYVVEPSWFGLLGRMVISNELCVRLRDAQLALARSFHIPEDVHAHRLYLLSYGFEAIPQLPSTEHTWAC